MSLLGGVKGLGSGGPVTKFLLRWLYVSSLIDDRERLQSVPQILHHPRHGPHPSSPLPGPGSSPIGNSVGASQGQYQYPQQPPPPPLSEYTEFADPIGFEQQQRVHCPHETQQQQQHHHAEFLPPPPPPPPDQAADHKSNGADAAHPQQPLPPSPPMMGTPLPPQRSTTSQFEISATTGVSRRAEEEEREFRVRCLRSVASYPPGVPRLLALDSLRMELVSDLFARLKKADEVVERSKEQQEVGCDGKKVGWTLPSPSAARPAFVHGRRKGGKANHVVVEDKGDDAGRGEDGEQDEGATWKAGEHIQEECYYGYEDEEEEDLLDADWTVEREWREATAGTTGGFSLVGTAGGGSDEYDLSDSIHDRAAESENDVHRSEPLNVGDESPMTMATAPVMRQHQPESHDHGGRAGVGQMQAETSGGTTTANFLCDGDDTAPVSEERVTRGKVEASNPNAAEEAAEVAVSEATERERAQRNRELSEARGLLREMREYLPQLVSAVLHSPPALTTDCGLDPVFDLRKLLVATCIEHPNFGIELCWLLEAEVGRAWKTLFEHRQQTGRRLIVVLPAEKALVLAQIGIEKRAAFDLLQDAEQAAAYGSSSGMDDDPDLPPRLPASLSLRRCGHFGDTMHFVDFLTQVSLDLRMVPILHRNAILQEKLSELNRRVRRRMVTQGAVNLDEDDGLGPHDWPHVTDVSMDMLCHSVHFPLKPMSLEWCGGRGSHSLDIPSAAATEKIGGVVRVLNIVSGECRLLASRERCPVLVHLEVVETGLDGNDARVYGSGADLGVTLEEVLGTGRGHPSQSGPPRYHVPPELLGSGSSNKDGSEIVFRNGRSPTLCGNEDQAVPRGGWQDDGFYPGNFMHPGQYEMLRQHQIEMLHEQMQNQQYQSQGQPHPSSPSGRSSLKGAELLDKIFGEKWAGKCEKIRQGSPYGSVKGWRLASFIMKAGEDIRREALVMQVIAKLNSWFQEELPEEQRPYLHPYTIMCVGGDAGLIECIRDAKSIDEVKKAFTGFATLRQYFERAYGPPQTNDGRSPQPSPQPPVRSEMTIGFEKAQENFLRSLVGYSLVCYIVQIKDRHNANILLDREGHMAHIDFGFVLGETPKMGKVPLFSERAPFKLTTEFWDVIGGWNVDQGGLGVHFCKMLDAAFACASAHSEELATLIEAAFLNLSQNSVEARSVADGVRARLRMRGPPDSRQQKEFIVDLVNGALTSWGTSTYDWLQKSMHGYQ